MRVTCTGLSIAVTQRIGIYEGSEKKASSSLSGISPRHLRNFLFLFEFLLLLYESFSENISLQQFQQLQRQLAFAAPSAAISLSQPFRLIRRSAGFLQLCFHISPCRRIFFSRRRWFRRKKRWCRFRYFRLSFHRHNSWLSFLRVERMIFSLELIVIFTRVFYFQKVAC